MAADPECLFCRIVAGEIPASVVRRTDRTLAFLDIAPAAPTHILVIPVEHHRDLDSLAAADPGLLAELVADATTTAQEAGVGGGWRLVSNIGPEAGQTVFHAHLHVIGGRAMTWPPG